MNMAFQDKQIKDLLTRLQKVRDILKIDNLYLELVDFEQQMAAPNFWSDQDRAKKIGQEASQIKSEIDAYEELQAELREASEVAVLAESENDTEMLAVIKDQLYGVASRLQKLEFSTLLDGEHDKGDAIISLHAGAGGDDASDWASLLFRMIIRYAESKDWQVEILEQSLGEGAGIKSITFAVRGRFAYGFLKAEAGVHRLVRISPFDAEKMRHTSFALCEVIPELSEVQESSIAIDEKDLRIDTFASSGAGGQSVNTTNSAVRITHIPTNTVVSIQNERSQGQNKMTAMKILKSRLYQKMLAEQKAEIKDLRGGHIAPEWGNQIRSYVLHPYKMVKDHRTGYETQAVEGVLNGELEPFIEAFLQKTALER